MKGGSQPGRRVGGGSLQEPLPLWAWLQSARTCRGPRTPCGDSPFTAPGYRDGTASCGSKPRPPAFSRFPPWQRLKTPPSPPSFSFSRSGRDRAQLAVSHSSFHKLQTHTTVIKQPMETTIPRMPPFPEPPNRKYQFKRRRNPRIIYQWELQILRQSRQGSVQWCSAWQATAALLPAARGSEGTSGVRTLLLALSR